MDDPRLLRRAYAGKGRGWGWVAYVGLGWRNAGGLAWGVALGWGWTSGYPWRPWPRIGRMSEVVRYFRRAPLIRRRVGLTCAGFLVEVFADEVFDG